MKFADCCMVNGVARGELFGSNFVFVVVLNHFQNVM